MNKQNVRDLVWLSAVSVDLVGSTEIEKTDKEKGKRCKELFRITAEKTYERFGAERTEWHGEGTVFFFREVDEAIRASIGFIGEIRVGSRNVEADMATRISLSSGLVELKEELGTMDAPFISLCGHLNSACPENSILITEDVYDNLPEELREKFGLCGTTRRDNVLAFIYPKEKRLRKDPEKFLPETEDPASDLRTYLDTIKGQCRTLLFAGIPQSSKIPLLELTESFFPLKVRKRRKEPIIERWKDMPQASVKLDIAACSESSPYPFAGIFKEEKQIIVLGDPGSGKTTLLRWLCLLYCQGIKAVLDQGLGDKRLLPLLVPVSSLYLERKKNVHINPVDAIANYIADLGVKLSTDCLEKKLNNGECLILLDGLDEIPEKKDRINMAKYIEGFIRRFEKNRFIITSRIVGYEEIRVSANEYLLAELEDDEIGRFGYNWFLAFEKTVCGKTALAEREAEKRRKVIVEAVRESPDIKRLAKNPFLLTYICIIQVQGQTLPRYRVDLYRLMCESLFSTWVTARRPFGDTLTTPIDYREGEKVLAPLALWMHREIPGGIVSGDRIKAEIVRIMTKDRGIPEKEARDGTKRFFEYLADQTQLLVDRGGDRWGFRHRTFEEFLSARVLIMKEEYFRYLKKYSCDPQWEEVFLLLAGWIGIIDGRENEVSRIVEGLLERKDELENILHKNLLLAGKIVAENVGVKRDLAERIIDEVIDLALRSEYSTLRKEARKVLKKGREISAGRISEILVDKKEASDVRRKAARALGEIGSDESIPLLTSVLKDKGEDEWVRGGATWALDKIGKEESIPVLISVLKDKKEDEEVRGKAVFVLEKISKEESIPVLTSILKDKGESKWVRRMAAWALGVIGKDKSISLLISILKDKEEDKEVRGEVARVLGEIGKDKSIPLLTSILKDKKEDGWVREMAVLSLGEIVLSLGEIGSEESISILTSIFRDRGEDKEVREWTLRIYNWIGSEEFIPLLISILKDKKEDTGMRREAAQGLGEIGKADEEVISILREIIDRREEGVWIPALSSATELGLQIKGIEETIIKELKNPSLDPSDKNFLFDSLWRTSS